jgi:hypothetical protein
MAVDRKRILMGVPMHKGEICSQVLHSALMGSSDYHDVDIIPLGLSLLAKNFNLLWIRAYTSGYDYFILHHSDLGVVGNLSGYAGSWSDLLVERMEELKAAAMSAVIPLKGPDGLTSTAIELTKGDPYSLRRLTQTELQRCPVDFINRADLVEVMGINDQKAGALLVNTGCLIMNLRDFPWFERRWPGFSIEDKIAWNKSGRPDSYTIPEDWNMSRWFHYHGDGEFPYYATKELVIAHIGGRAFFNSEVWGKETDGPPGQCKLEDYENSYD